MRTLTASLIISTYNQPRELEFVLLRLLHQSVQGFEVIIADDGSTTETQVVIEKYRRRCPFPIRHCWHEHHGYRLPVILNRATLLAEAQYLIYLNGDCLPHRRYVEGHLLFRQPDRVLGGRRGVMIQPWLAGALTPGMVARQDFDHWIRMLYWQLRGDLRSFERRIRIVHPVLRRLFIGNPDNLVGADFSLFREAMFQVNGFDETMAGLGGSDRELGHRLKLLGLRLVNSRHLTITYHLEHPRNPERIHFQNEMKALLAQSCITFCRQGLQRLDSGSEIGTLLRDRFHRRASVAISKGNDGVLKKGSQRPLSVAQGGSGLADDKNC